ncbi:MAG: response regulator transcription factor [Rhodoferax sp.]|nr:response regulator transcription factor [Rhodoferax sp.]
MSRLILLDDERAFVDELAEYLLFRGYTVQCTYDAASFRAAMEEQSFDIAIMDAGLPDGDGFSLTTALRAQKQQIFVILLTARSRPEDKLSGYQAGADHYLTKPVRFDELSAIIASLERRIITTSWSLKLSQRRLFAPNGLSVDLTEKEFLFLRLLGSQANKTFDRRAIALAFDVEFIDYDQRRLDTLVSRLRHKVLDQTRLELPLHTAHGAGYLFDGRTVA